jgi:hypothetical protein
MSQSTLLRRLTSSSVNPKPGTSPLGHVRTYSTVIRVPYVQLAACVLYCFLPRGPTHHAYIPMSLTRTLPYPSQLTVHARETARVGSDTICNTSATPEFWGQARLTSEFFTVGLTKKKVYLSGMSILSIILSIEPGCHRNLGALDGHDDKQLHPS